MDDLLTDVSEDVKAEVARELDNRLAVDQPSVRTTSEGGDVSYDTIRAKLHNPFEVIDLLEQAGFRNTKVHWYHYHPAPPMIERQMKKRFWEEASRLEHTSTWRGYFLCSAFVVEAEVG